MSLIFDNTNSDNPITAIEEVHHAFRTKIRQNCASYVIKFKWMKNYEIDKALHEYMIATEQAGLIKSWNGLLKKLEEEAKTEFADKCDEWMLGSLAIFKLDEEIEQAFVLEWNLLGAKPDNLL